MPALIGFFLLVSEAELFFPHMFIGYSEDTLFHLLIGLFAFFLFSFCVLCIF